MQTRNLNKGVVSNLVTEARLHNLEGMLKAEKEKLEAGKKACDQLQQVWKDFWNHKKTEHATEQEAARMKNTRAEMNAKKTGLGLEATKTKIKHLEKRAARG